jgi:hypothetical protein
MLLASLLVCGPVLAGQTPTTADATEIAPVPDVQPALDNTRILGVIPNYLAVEDPTLAAPPLKPGDKWKLFVQETFDPFTPAAAALGAGISQLGNSHPKYGRGGMAYAERFGAALGDVTSQNFFSDYFLASVLHEDPRYFRKGPEFSWMNRVGYSLSRALVTRKDSGARTFNYSNVLGTVMGVGFSNLYYPPASRTGGVMLSRLGTGLLASALGNLLPEFWPDIHQRLKHK